MHFAFQAFILIDNESYFLSRDEHSFGFRSELLEIPCLEEELEDPQFLFQLCLSLGGRKKLSRNCCVFSPGDSLDTVRKIGNQFDPQHFFSTPLSVASMPA
jgi:hypothetical protein